MGIQLIFYRGRLQPSLNDVLIYISWISLQTEAKTTLAQTYWLYSWFFYYLLLFYYYKPRMHLSVHKRSQRCRGTGAPRTRTHFFGGRGGI